VDQIRLPAPPTRRNRRPLASVRTRLQCEYARTAQGNRGFRSRNASSDTRAAAETILPRPACVPQVIDNTYLEASRVADVPGVPDVSDVTRCHCFRVFSRTPRRRRSNRQDNFRRASRPRRRSFWTPIQAGLGASGVHCHCCAAAATDVLTCQLAEETPQVRFSGSGGRLALKLKATRQLRHALILK
jgi:hypothetical protein